MGSFLYQSDGCCPSLTQPSLMQLDTREETSGPAVSLANGQIAFVLGTGPAQTIAIASTTEGRLVRRLAGAKGRRISGLAASPDGKTLYFAADEFIWAIATEDGAPRKLAAGDAVTVSPDDRTLILTQSVRSNPRFMSVPPEGGSEKEIHLESGQSLAPVPIGSRALSRDGRLLINVSPPNSPRKPGLGRERIYYSDFYVGIVVSPYLWPWPKAIN